MRIDQENRKLFFSVLVLGPPGGGKKTFMRRFNNHLAGPPPLIQSRQNGAVSYGFEYLPWGLREIENYHLHHFYQSVDVHPQPGLNDLPALATLFDGADGVLFVADSSASLVSTNRDCLNMVKNIFSENGQKLVETRIGLETDFAREPDFPSSIIKTENIPWTLSCNKCEIADAMPFEQLKALLAPDNSYAHQGNFAEGNGIQMCVKHLSHRLHRCLYPNEKF